MLSFFYIHAKLPYTVFPKRLGDGSIDGLIQHSVTSILQPIQYWQSRRIILKFAEFSFERSSSFLTPPLASEAETPLGSSFRDKLGSLKLLRYGQTPPCWQGASPSFQLQRGQDSQAVGTRPLLAAGTQLWAFLRVIVAGGRGGGVAKHSLSASKKQSFAITELQRPILYFIFALDSFCLIWWTDAI